MKARAVAESHAAERGLTFIPKGALSFWPPTLGGGPRFVNGLLGAVAGGPRGILVQRGAWRGPSIPSAQYEISCLGDVIEGLWVHRSGRSIWTRVALPSKHTELLLPNDAFNAHWRVAAASDRDADAARRLLSGDFVAWLTELGMHGSRLDSSNSFEIRQSVLFIRGPLDSFNGPDKLSTFAATAARIATEVTALANPAPPSRATSHAWACAICGAVAGSIDVAEDGQMRRQSFTSSMTGPPSDTGIGRLRTALAAGDAAAVYALDPELAPWWCPDCSKSYCGAHWQHWDVFDEDCPTWHDSIRGRCPEGHERMLED